MLGNKENLKTFWLFTVSSYVVLTNLIDFHTSFKSVFVAECTENEICHLSPTVSFLSLEQKDFPQSTFQSKIIYE